MESLLNVLVVDDSIDSHILVPQLLCNECFVDVAINPDDATDKIQESEGAPYDWVLIGLDSSKYRPIAGLDVSLDLSLFAGRYGAQAATVHYYDHSKPFIDQVIDIKIYGRKGKVKDVVEFNVDKDPLVNLYRYFDLNLNEIKRVGVESHLEFMEKCQADPTHAHTELHCLNWSEVFRIVSQHTLERVRPKRALTPQFKNRLAYQPLWKKAS